jgi:hypothetical protein
MFQKYAASVSISVVKVDRDVTKVDLDVAKVDREIAKGDRDVVHVAMAMHVCFKCMFKVFLSGCCKSRSGSCIYMHTARVCFKGFMRLLQLFYLDVAYVCNDFQVFLDIFCMYFIHMF